MVMQRCCFSIHVLLLYFHRYVFLDFSPVSILFEEKHVLQISKCLQSLGVVLLRVHMAVNSDIFTLCIYMSKAITNYSVSHMMYIVIVKNIIYTLAVST